LLNFHSYFTKYAPFLPVFPSELSPNIYYDEALLVFWAILTVAARRYEKDPTLLTALSSRVMRLALLSVNTKSSGLPVIKGLLILLTWAIPETEVSDETPYVLCGAAIHLATKIGLHVPLASQDFARVRLELTEQAIHRRAELWAHVTILYQRYVFQLYLAFDGLTISDIIVKLESLSGRFLASPGFTVNLKSKSVHQRTRVFTCNSRNWLQRLTWLSRNMA
jgi:hypothetical protein